MAQLHTCAQVVETVLLIKVDKVVYHSENSDHSCEDSRDEILQSSGDESELWCICQEGGSMYGDMIECCSEH